MVQNKKTTIGIPPTILEAKKKNSVYGNISDVAFISALSFIIICKATDYTEYAFFVYHRQNKFFISHAYDGRQTFLELCQDFQGLFSNKAKHVNQEFQPFFDLFFEDGKCEQFEIGIHKYRVSLLYCFQERVTLLAESVLCQAYSCISQLDILLSKERSSLRRFNQTDEPVPILHITHELYLRARSCHGTAVLYQQGHSPISYEELFCQVQFAAQVLLAEGIEKQDVVGVFSQPSIQTVILFFAILYIGAVYLPLSIKMPENYIEHIIDESKMKILISEFDTMPHIKIPTRSIINFYINDKKDGNKNSVLSPPTQVSADIAYIIYTSGSTGKPKGVRVTMMGLNNLLFTLRKRFDKGLKTVVFSDLSFDASIWEILLGVLVGNGLLILDQTTKYNRHMFVQTLREYNVSLVTLPPDYLTNFEPVDFPSVDMIITAGSKLNQDVFDKWKKHKKIVNAYGATENTVCATIGELVETVTIGKPNPNTHIHILDRYGSEQGIGMIGEIYIGGHLLANGYLDEAETKKRFVYNNTVTHGRLYRTGDMGYWTPDGEVVYMYRTDRQIKMNGYRIELDHIEVALLGHPDIQQVAVFLKNNTYIYAVYEASLELEQAQLGQYLMKFIPSYMLPHAYCRVAEIPVNNSGKKDYKKLSSQTGFGVSCQEKSISSVIKDIFLKTLAVEQIDMESNFFLSGGNSMRAMEATFQLEKTFGISLDITDIYLYPSIAALSERIESIRRNDKDEQGV